MTVKTGCNAANLRLNLRTFYPSRSFPRTRSSSPTNNRLRTLRTLPIELKNSRSLVSPNSLKWKLLLVGKPGVGKTTFLSGVPGVFIAACETGHGSGLLSAAHSSVPFDFCEPKSFTDFRSICLNTFEPAQKNEAVALDSLSAMTKTFIKDHVLATFPSRNQKEAMRRQAGVMTGFDYGDVADVTRTLVQQLLQQPRHVIVTCTEKAEKDDNGVIVSIGPDLPGQLALGAPAMFDTVLYLKARKRLRDPRDPKSVYDERYFVTSNDGLHIAKDRNSTGGKSFLDREEVFDIEKGSGTFTTLFNKILAGHASAV